MKTIFSIAFTCLLLSCKQSQYKGNNIVRYQPPSLKQKIQGNWNTQKVVYDFGLIDNDPKRQIEFDLHGFFEVKYFYKDEWRIKTNFYAVEDDQIHLINKETMKVYEIAEVTKVTSTTLVISTITPIDNKYTVHMTR